MQLKNPNVFSISLALATGLISANQAFGQVYIEGSLSVVNVDDVSTIPYSGSSGGITFNNLSGTVDYDNATAYGIELGYYVAPSFRVSLSYNRFSLDWDTITVSAGSISDGTTTVSGSGTVTRGQLSGDSAFDNDVSLVMINAYYDFDTQVSFTPYIGLGFGRADISNAVGDEDAVAIMLGVNYDLGSNNYIGARYTRYRVDGPTDQLGFQYQDVTTNAFSITFTHRF